MPLYQIAALFLLGMGLIAFVCYGRDKALARRHKWRIPEKTLLLLGFCGGSIGALAGMLLFRHKTKHWYFWLVNLTGLLWQTGLTGYLFLHEQGII